MVKPEELTNDQLLYHAIRHLIEMGEKELADMLLLCELEKWEVDIDNDILIGIVGPGNVANTLNSDPDFSSEYNQDTNFRRITINEAFSAVFRRRSYTRYYQYLETEIGEDWREHLKQLAKGEKVSNQARDFGPKPKSATITWHNLRFRSQPEKKIAEALERAAVLFFPNCAARLGTSEHRMNREPDFLICIDGKCGILEVDGMSYHKQASIEQEEDRQFMNHGIKVVLHFDAQKCFNDPDGVVTEFLRILRNS